MKGEQQGLVTEEEIGGHRPEGEGVVVSQRRLGEKAAHRIHGLQRDTATAHKQSSWEGARRRTIWMSPLAIYLWISCWHLSLAESNQKPKGKGDVHKCQTSGQKAGWGRVGKWDVERNGDYPAQMGEEHRNRKH